MIKIWLFQKYFISLHRKYKSNNQTPKAMEQQKVIIAKVHFKDGEGIDRVTNTWSDSMRDIENYVSPYRYDASKIEISSAEIWSKDNEDNYQGKRSKFIVSGQTAEGDTLRKTFNVFGSVFEWVEEMKLDKIEIRRAVIL